MNDKKYMLENGIELLTIVDSLYWKLFYDHPSEIPPPHVYFCNFFGSNDATNEYEAYWESRNKEASLILPLVSDLCFSTEGTPSGQYEGTMRGSDPCLPKNIVRYMDSVRDDAARYYAFAVPTKKAA
jgi:hypothetical protein